MEKELKKQEIIRQIRAIAAANGGSAPGMEKFESETGIKKHEWKYKIWRKWGDALIDAGLNPNVFGGKIDDELLLDGILGLAIKLQTFPNMGDLAFEASHNKNFPRHKTVRGNQQVAEMCTTYLENQPTKAPVPKEGAAQVGYVYLIRYEKHFKIGRTNSMVKRSRQVQIELPNETVRIHEILTDDPVGVEAYWHKRFADRRGSGEWFNLSKADIAAFKKWTKIA